MEYWWKHIVNRCWFVRYRRRCTSWRRINVSSPSTGLWSCWNWRSAGHPNTPGLALVLYIYRRLWYITEWFSIIVAARRKWNCYSLAIQKWRKLISSDIYHHVQKCAGDYYNMTKKVKIKMWQKFRLKYNTCKPSNR